MRSRIVLTLVAVASLSAVSTAEPKKTDEAIAAELKALAGKWKATKVIKQGKDEGSEASKGQIIFNGSRIKILERDEVLVETEFTVNPSSSPKTMDFTVVDDGKKIELKGIYEIKGNQMKFCFGLPESTKDRPKSFEAGKLVTLIELERVKE